MRQINLLPHSYQKNMRMRAFKKSLTVSCVVLALILVPVYLWLSDGVRELETKLSRIKLSRAMPELNKIRSEVKQNKDKRDAFTDDNRVLLELSAERVQYKGMLKYVGDITANKVWLDKVMISRKMKVMEMQGKSFDAQLVSEFLLELKKLPYFTSVDLTSMQSNTVNNDTVVVFSVTCAFE